MKTIVIYDRQPIVRLGLKLIIEAYDQSFCFHQINSIDLLSAQNVPGEVFAIVLGLDPECEKVNSRMFKSIKDQFPNSCLIVYADNIHHCRVLSYFKQGVSGYVSKQACETEFVSCLRYVMDNKRYISSKIRDLLVNELSLSEKANDSAAKLSSAERKIACYLNNGWIRQ